MLQANIIMICIIHKILVLLKINRTLKRFLRSITNFNFFKNNKFISQDTTMENPRPNRQKET